MHRLAKLPIFAYCWLVVISTAWYHHNGSFLNPYATGQLSAHAVTSIVCMYAGCACLCWWAGLQCARQKVLLPPYLQEHQLRRLCHFLDRVSHVTLVCMLSGEIAGAPYSMSVSLLRHSFAILLAIFVHLAVSQTAPEYLQRMLVDAALDLLHSKL